MNYLQLVQRLKREAGRSGTVMATLAGLDAEDQRLADAVAEAWLELQRRPHGWTWMRKELTGTLVAAQSVYTAVQLNGAATDLGRWLPPATEGYQVMAMVSGGSGPWVLHFLPWEEYRRRFVLTPNAAAPPVFYSIAPDDKFCVGPTPTATTTLYATYYRTPTTLTVDANTPDIGTEYHLILMWRALMEIGSFDAATEVYSRAAANFTNLDSDLRARYGPVMGFANVTLR